MKKIILLMIIMIMGLSSLTFAFADSDILSNEGTLLVAASSDDAPQLVTDDEEREFKTSRKYSLQIFIVIAVLMALYRGYKYIKYKR